MAHKPALRRCAGAKRQGHLPVASACITRRRFATCSLVCVIHRRTQNTCCAPPLSSYRIVQRPRARQSPVGADLDVIDFAANDTAGHGWPVRKSSSGGSKEAKAFAATERYFGLC